MSVKQFTRIFSLVLLAVSMVVGLSVSAQSDDETGILQFQVAEDGCLLYTSDAADE